MAVRRGRAVLLAVGLTVAGVLAALLVAVDPAGALAPPAVRSVSPTSGKTAGGTRVTVTGTGFTHVRSVKFGTTSGTSINVVSSTKLAVTSPAHAAGLVGIHVTTTAGTSAAVTADHYTYVAPPAVTGVSPTSGKTAAGTRVTITGARFIHVTAVKFGTTSGTSISVVSSTKLAVTAPAHAAGLVGIRITTAYGTSPSVTADHYTYVAPPVISSVAPSSGTTAGGTRVTVTGTNFVHVTAVTFAGVAGTSLSMTSSAKLAITAPAHTAGLVTMQVKTIYGASASVTADHYTYIAPPGPVTATAMTAETTTTLTLEWTNPTGGGFSGVVIRRATGIAPPGSRTAGTLVTETSGSTAAFTDHGLTAGTSYSYALFAHSAADAYAAADTVTAKTNSPLALTSTALPDATAGLTYQAVLTATGGTEPYTWAATGLPAGLTLSSDGVISGFPAGTGTSQVTVTVTDTENTSRQISLSLAVPDALPAQCAAQSCALLTPDGHTVHIPAADITGVTRDPTTNAVTQVVLTGISVAHDDVLVLAATPDLPSGLIAVAGTVTDNGDGTFTVTVTPATPADAYAEGTVQALAPAAPTAGAATKSGPVTSRQGVSAGSATTTTTAAAGPDLKCDNGVTTDLLGLSVTPSLTPAVAALWKHPFFGGGGVYIGTGGLQLFQVDLDGSVTVNLGVSVSGAATCTLTLPSIVKAVPAGQLGAVVLTLTPKLTLKVSAKVDLRASVTLSCGYEYRWDQGQELHLSYCGDTYQPLQLSADSGADVTLSATDDASVTLDDIAGITGTLTDYLHAGFHPAAHPVAELDAGVDYELGACLACFWDGSPLNVTIASGELAHIVLASYDTPPPAVPPVITTTVLPSGTVGQLYKTVLDTADHRPGTWTVPSGSLPGGLTLSGDAISGTPTGAGTSTFQLRFVDSDGQAVTATAAITVSPVSAGDGWVPSFALPPADGTGITPFVEPDVVSCAGAGFCVAAGEYIGDSGGYRGLLETFSGGAWTPAPAPLPADADASQNASLSSVACAGPGSCAAAGSYSPNNTNASGGLLETLSGGRWIPAAARLPADAQVGTVNLPSVACGGPGSCVAVGDYPTVNFSGGLIETLSGAVWTATAAPAPAGATQVSLTSVACGGPGSCVAVGYYDDGASGQFGLLETLSGGVWTATTAPPPAAAAAGTVGYVQSVACGGPGSCVAVGSYSDAVAGGENGLLETLSGGAWTASTAPLPADDAGSPSSVWRVACGGPGSCVAVGAVRRVGTAFVQDGLLETLAGGVWTASTAPLPADATANDNGHLSSVACRAAGSCTAVGAYGNAAITNDSRALIEELSGGAWTVAAAPLPGDPGTSTFSELYAVSCGPGGPCAAVGDDETLVPPGGYRGLLEARQ
jgi:hypothetical protein